MVETGERVTPNNGVRRMLSGSYREEFRLGGQLAEQPLNSYGYVSI